MKRELKIRENETLDEWCSRIALYLATDKASYAALKVILHEISVESYIHGCNETLNEAKRRRDEQQKA